MAIALGGFAYSRLLAIREDTVAISSDALPGVQLMGDITSVSKDIRGAILQHILATQPDDKSAFDAKIQAAGAATDKALKAYESTMTTSQEREQYAQIKAALAEYRDIRETVVLPLSRQGKNAEAFEKFRTVLTPTMERYFAALDTVEQYNTDEAKRLAGDNEAAVHAAVSGILIGVIVAILVGAGVAFLIVSSTNKSLTTALASLTEGAQQVVSAAGQVSTSAQSLSQGATEQAASLEETSASMEEMASMTRKNAENAARGGRAGDRRGAAGDRVERRR